MGQEGNSCSNFDSSCESDPQVLMLQGAGVITSIAVFIHALQHPCLAGQLRRAGCDQIRYIHPSRHPSAPSLYLKTTHFFEGALWFEGSTVHPGTPPSVLAPLVQSSTWSNPVHRLHRNTAKASDKINKLLNMLHCLTFSHALIARASAAYAKHTLCQRVVERFTAWPCPTELMAGPFMSGCTPHNLISAASAARPKDILSLSRPLAN